MESEDIALLANAQAGHGLKYWPRVQIKGHKFAAIGLSNTPEEAKDILQSYYEKGCRKYLFLGGDGTLFQGINILKRLNQSNLENILFGALNGGSGNGVAKVSGAGNPLEDWNNILSYTTSLPFKTFPLVQVTAQRKSGEEIGPWYFTFAGAGADALLLKYQKESFFSGLTAYLTAIPQMMPVLWNGRYPYARIQSKVEDQEWYQINADGKNNPFSASELEEKNIHSVLVGTTAYYGYSFKAFPYANEAVEQNLMHLRIATGQVFRKGWQYINNAIPIWTGSWRNEDMIELLASEIEIHYPKQPGPLQIAGDYFGEVEKVQFKVSDKVNLIDFKKLRESRV